MKPYVANIINGVILVALGLIGAWVAMNNFDDPSKTIFIAPAFGALFLLLTPGMKKDNKVVAHIVVLFTLLLLIMFVAVPLPKAIAADPRDMGKVLRITTMSFSCLLAIVVFVKSFINARKNKA